MTPFVLNGSQRNDLMRMVDAMHTVEDNLMGVNALMAQHCQWYDPTNTQHSRVCWQYLHDLPHHPQMARSIAYMKMFLDHMFRKEQSRQNRIDSVG